MDLHGIVDPFKFDQLQHLLVDSLEAEGEDAEEAIDDESEPLLFLNG